MLLIRGEASGTTLTGSLYEEGERPPAFKGAPNEDAPYVWVCDEFYEVESGGTVQRLDDREVNLAFESPMPRGFQSREDAIAGAKDHLRTQFARIGIPGDSVSITVIEQTD